MKLRQFDDISLNDINYLKSVPMQFLRITLTHYENTPMQYTVIFHSCKNDNF